MCPASRNLQILTFFFKRVVDLIAIRYTDSIEFLQEFPWVACIAARLVFVQNDLFIGIHSATAVDPHIMFGPLGPVLFCKRTGVSSACIT